MDLDLILSHILQIIIINFYLTSITCVASGTIQEKKIAEIRKKDIEENSVFAEKRYLDSMILLSKIIGREAEMDVEKSTS